MINVIPKPNKVTLVEDSPFSTSNGLKIICDVQDIADIISGYLLKLGVNLSDDATSVLNITGKDTPSQIGDDESYTLTIAGDTATVWADSRSGMLYGGISFVQLYFAAYNMSAPIQAVTIEDAPKYAYRSYMLDVSRHFFPIEYLYKVVDDLLLHKLNVFHLHLTDDQGWRVEIRAYPRLTEIGSQRSATNKDKTPHGGFYTQSELRGLVAYAQARGVTIVPELDLPGHFSAALASYPELGCTGKEIPVPTTFGIKRDILCCGKESSYRFLKDVFEELAEIFPSPYYHIGGDEAFRINWKTCPHCLAKADELGLDSVYDLQSHVTEYVVDILQSLGKRAIVWNETFASGDTVSPSVVCQYWSDGKDAPNVTREMLSGRKVIMSRTLPFYLDYPFALNSLKSTYHAPHRLKNVPDGVFFGFDSPMWTEWVATPERAEYLTYPRLTATAEICWSDKTDYYSFLRNLNVIYPAYAKLGIHAAPLIKVNPGKIAGLIEMLKFYPKNLLCADQKRQAASEGKLWFAETKEIAELRRKKAKKQQ